MTTTVEHEKPDAATGMPPAGDAKPPEKREVPEIEPLYSYQEAEAWLLQNSDKRYQLSDGTEFELSESGWRHVLDDHDEDDAEDRWLVAMGVPEVVQNPELKETALYKDQEMVYFVGSVLVTGETRKTILLVSTKGSTDGILRLMTWFTQRSIEDARKYLSRVTEQP